MKPFKDVMPTETTVTTVLNALTDDGLPVIVSWSSLPLKRNGFHTQASVAGKLESKKTAWGFAWRVVIDDQTYAYINDVNHVIGIAGRVSTGHYVISIDGKHEGACKCRIEIVS